MLIWALLRSCDCSEPPSEVTSTPPAVTIDVPESQPKEVVTPKNTTKKRFKGRISTRLRARYDGEAPAQQTWLTVFRMQVAARSPRLASCFEGIETPGAMKWTATIHLKKGTISDHDFEPVLDGASLSAPLKACLANVLSKPSYRLTVPSTATRSSRVAMVIEF